MIDQVKITIPKQESTFGEVVIEPLPQGYGLTLGNALRRVLLTSLKGMAITAVKIAGVAHEYSTIEGVKEDVVEILLNLKKIRLSKEDSDSKEVKLTLSEKGSKEVKAKDLKVTGNAKIANPDLVIATLASAKTKFELEATAESGVGYLPVEDRRSSGIGIIPLDAVFSPVLRVNYKVEATRVGQITNFDKLTLQIYTDGSILPENALREAARILDEYFGLLQRPFGEDSQEVKTKISTHFVRGVSKEDLIEELDLPTRVTNSLKTAGIETIGSLLTTPPEKILSLKNLGAKSYSTIEEKLAEKGLSVGS